MINVWIDAWEMECCGEPFSVGDFVQWPTEPVDKSDWLERLFENTRVVVHRAYRGHDDDGISAGQVAGRVERIEAISSAVGRTPVDAHGDILQVVDGTAGRHPLDRADRQRPVAESCDRKFLGYLVTLDE